MLGTPRWTGAATLDGRDDVVRAGTDRSDDATAAAPLIEGDERHRRDHQQDHDRAATGTSSVDRQRRVLPSRGECGRDQKDQLPCDEISTCLSASNSSRHWPDPMTTDVSGLPATRMGMPVSDASRVSSPWSSAPPPSFGPPPMSTTMLPVGSCPGRPAPIAAAIGSSMMNAGLRAPAYSA